MDQTSGMIDMVDNINFPDTERYGVSISYNYPTLRLSISQSRDGEEYNRKDGVMEKIMRSLVGLRSLSRATDYT